ncbi:MAG: GntR family transcriptional regulator [Clostridia bacterium]|nr:GntR family transcriptional regulator [Clostridia bacterium]
MELNYGDHRPIYEQIKEKTKEYIISGAMAEHERLPSVREVAAQLAINPNTIQRAYKELEMEGYIYSQKAKGYFVAPMKKSVQTIKKEEAFENLETIVKELKYLGTEETEIEKMIKKIYWEGNK